MEYITLTISRDDLEFIFNDFQNRTDKADEAKKLMKKVAFLTKQKPDFSKMDYDVRRMSEILAVLNPVLK